MRGVRGQNRNPGEYRRIPNWIGPKGCSLEEAHFVPIGAENLPEAMNQWERFIHVKYHDKLVQLGILHAEFESIHPFLDGNGRPGRMFVPLFLFAAGQLTQPVFYISAYFEKYRDEYYERLLLVSRDDDWTGWVIFFLKAVTEQAKENQDRASQILSLHEEKRREIAELTHSQFAGHAVDFLFKKSNFQGF